MTVDRRCWGQFCPPRPSSHLSLLQSPGKQFPTMSRSVIHLLLGGGTQSSPCLPSGWAAFDLLSNHMSPSQGLMASPLVSTEPPNRSYLLPNLLPKQWKVLFP
eukprot:Lithocolla_globosa_v1_NODE_3161_length_1744_cov_21.605684.p2 type:complete len:103 gc:universal NODE_3161_length_1744_cov_21.605684:658-350(-)